MPAGSTMARIAARGALIVGIDQSTVPLSYRDPRSGVLTGLDVRFAQEMARAIFGDPNRVRFRIESSAQRIPNLLAGNVDLVVQAMTVTCERKRADRDVVGVLRRRTAPRGAGGLPRDEHRRARRAAGLLDHRHDVDRDAPGGARDQRAGRRWSSACRRTPTAW